MFKNKLQGGEEKEEIEEKIMPYDRYYSKKSQRYYYKSYLSARKYSRSGDRILLSPKQGFYVKRPSYKKKWWF